MVRYNHEPHGCTIRQVDRLFSITVTTAEGCFCSFAAPSRSNRRDGLGFMAGAFAWITCIMIVVFIIVSSKVLASMEFKQDSLLYGRTKTD